jgi:hypothetical protein
VEFTQTLGSGNLLVELHYILLYCIKLHVVVLMLCYYCHIQSGVKALDT